MMESLTKDNDMTPRNLILSVSAALLLASGAAQSHEDEDKGQVGRVKFTNSCDPKVQRLLETGVAMLHSFWFSATEKASDRKSVV